VVVYDAFVLAAGLGTRLRPLTEHAPKPLVPVCGVPLLSYSLASCARHGLRDVVVNAHWLAEQLEPWAGERDGVRVTVSTERPEVLGTGGGLRKVADQLASPFAILNGDVLQDVDLGALLAAVPPGGAAMALRPHPTEAVCYGVVAADGSGIVTRLVSLARAEPVGPVDETTHFTGIHAMTREAVALIPPAGFSDVVRTAYLALVPQRKVAGLRADGVWLDAGDPAAYLDANLQVLSGRLRLALDPHARAAWARDATGRVLGDEAVLAGARVTGAAWVGPGAELGRGVALEDTVVGAGARVATGARLTRVVVWDGCAAAGDLTDAIVFPGGVLPVGRST
jgi:mannose-1-phosphate guanylyltransferase